MEKTIGISDKFIRAEKTGNGAATIQVTGVVGMDFSGMDLARFVESWSNDGYDITIELDSVGGFASDAFAFYDQVRAKGLKVHVDGYGMVASAATVIMAAAGRKRSRLSPNAEYLVHNASGADAESLKRANSKMADIYVEVTGKDKKAILDLMKQDKPMGAEEARKWGFVGSVIELQKLAAVVADKNNNMEDTVKEKRVVDVKPAEAFAAAFSGKMEIEVDIDAEAATQISAYAEEVKSLKAEATELKDEVDAKATALDTLKAEVTKVEGELADAKAEAEAKAKEVDTLKAQIVALKKTPIEKPLAKGGEAPVVPDGDPPKVTATSTKAENYAKTLAYVQGMAKPINK